eukprot:jgi/Psemu1/327956/estExt_fgenesh1_pg.C_9150001
MKLRAPNDLVVHEKISEWVAIQRLPSNISTGQTSTCRVASALLLQRLVRAFEQRLNMSVDESQATKVDVVRPKVLNSIAPKKSFSAKAKQKPSTDLGALMQRKVKVTRLVQHAVQFVGSDVLKVLQVLAPSPTVADVAIVSPTTFAPDTEARNVCWKIARLLALNEDHKSKSDPESKDHRRNHILFSATSIILAANMGKSIENADLYVKDSAAPKQGSVPIHEDFVCMVAGPVAKLLSFINQNVVATAPITPITTIDIRSHFQNICAMINKLAIMKNPTASVIASPWRSDSILAKAFPSANEYFLLRNYRNIVQALVVETQKNLKIHTVQGATGPTERTAIVNVLLLFPMVIGEPWGIHRDAPMITSRMLCSGIDTIPSEALRDSVAIVMKLKPRPKEIKRKANGAIPDVIRADKKKARTLSVPLPPPKNISVEAIDLVGDDSPATSPRVSTDIEVGEVEAPVINDGTELNEWIISVLSLSVIKPSDTLLSYLGENDKKYGDGTSCLSNVIVPIINRGSLRIQSALRSLSNLASKSTSTVLTVGKRDGQVYVNGQIDQSIQLCASVVGFYYHSLEAIVCDQMERLEFVGSFSSMLRSETFHRALLACCYTCVLKGVGNTQKFAIYKDFNKTTAQVVMETTESDSFTFLKVIDALCSALVDTRNIPPKRRGYLIVAGLPVLIQQHIQKLQIQLIDSVIWNTSPTTENSTHSSLALIIKTVRSLKGAWPPDVLELLLPEEISEMESTPSKRTGTRCKPPFASSVDANFLSFVLRKLLSSVFLRIMAMCAALGLSNETVVHSQILVAFRYLLRHHISILQDRHVDQLLLCSIYGVCRVMKIQPQITFGKVIEAYFTVRGEEQGERACRVIVRHVKLDSAKDRDQPGSQVVGNIVVFYNQVYVPRMQKYFTGNKSLKKSAEVYEVKRKEMEKHRREVEEHRKEKKEFEKEKQMFHKRKVNDSSSEKFSLVTSTNSNSRPIDAERVEANANPRGNQSSRKQRSNPEASAQKNVSRTITVSGTVVSMEACGNGSSSNSNRSILNGTTSTVSEQSMANKTVAQETEMNNSETCQTQKNALTEPAELTYAVKMARANGADLKMVESSDTSKSENCSRIKNPKSSSHKPCASFGSTEVNPRESNDKALGKNSTVAIEKSTTVTMDGDGNPAKDDVL